MSPFCILLELMITELVVTAGAVRRVKLQSNHLCQQANPQLFTGQMPRYHMPWTCSTKAHPNVVQPCLWPLTAPCCTSLNAVKIVSTVPGILQNGAIRHLLVQFGHKFWREVYRVVETSNSWEIFPLSYNGHLLFWADSSRFNIILAHWIFDSITYWHVTGSQCRQFSVSWIFRAILQNLWLGSAACKGMWLLLCSGMAWNSTILMLSMNMLKK